MEFISFVQTAAVRWTGASRGVWRCFHCDEVFTTPGSAEDHFGSALGSEPGCKLKQVEVGEERGLLMDMRKAEKRAREAETESETLACQVESLTTAMQSYAPFRKCRSINEVFFVYDSAEGRALAAEERLAESTRLLGIAREAIRSKLADCRKHGECSDAALMDEEYCSTECTNMSRALAQITEPPSVGRNSEKENAE